LEIAAGAQPVAVVVQETHRRRAVYDPWGLELAGIGYLADPAKESKFTYNGKEKQDQFGLGWLDYHARQVDPALGRMWAVDPLAGKFAPVSPYNYALNNPLRFIDPTGMEARSVQEMVQEAWDNTPDGESRSFDFPTGFYRNQTTGAVVTMNANSGQQEVQGFDFLGTNPLSKNISDAIGADIMRGGWNKFIGYYEMLGADFFFNAAAANYTTGARGLMAVLTHESIDPAHRGLLLSEMTHDWVRTAASLIPINQELINPLEHQLGVFLMIEVFGIENTSLVVSANEWRGLLFTDRNNDNMINALLGRPANGGGPTGFQYSDIIHNFEGAQKWRQYQIDRYGYFGYLAREIRRETERLLK
jgi:RHS repeat-associated protein